MLGISLAATRAMPAAVADFTPKAPVDGRLGAHPYASHVHEAARRFGIPEAWIWQVMRVESGGDARAVSRAGAMGLMQLMPATWSALRSQFGLGNDPFNVRDNILAGAAYLRALHDRYGNPRAMLGAYNAGPGRYDDYLARGRPLPAETQAYLAKLAPVFGIANDEQLTVVPATNALAWRGGALFVRSGAVQLSTDAKFVAYSNSNKPAGADPATGRQLERGRDDRRSAPDNSKPSQSDNLFVSRDGAGRPR